MTVLQQLPTLVPPLATGCVEEAENLYLCVCVGGGGVFRSRGTAFKELHPDFYMVRCWTLGQC